MNNIIMNTINEIQKLFSKKKTTVFLIILAIISFLPAFFLSAIKERLFFIALDSISFPLIILSAAANILIPLFIFMAAAELFSGEVADRNMKLVLTRPINRFKVYISKNIAIGIYAIINIFVVFIVSTISSLVLGFDTQNISHIFFNYFIDIIPAIIFTLFASLIVQFFRSSSVAIISGILIFGLIKILSLLITGFNNIIFTSYLNWYGLWSGAAGSFFKNINNLIMLGAYGIIFFTIGYYLFDTKEF